MRLAASWSLCVLGALGVAVSLTLMSASILPDAQAYAQAWDRRDDRIRESKAASVREVVVAPMAHIGDLAELEADPGNWLNACVALYHGVDSVRAR